jgi:nitrite reductase/ring-hydroxylating ferredoxin subunit
MYPAGQAGNEGARMSGPGDAEWHLVAKTGDVEEDEPRAVSIGDRQIAVYRVDGGFYATGNICTHEYACMSDGFVDGDVIECPLHAGRFHIPTGKALSPPVTEDLRSYPVKLEGDDIYVDVAGG